jgi:hypothetical protein
MTEPRDDRLPSDPSQQSPVLEAIRNVVETSVTHATADLREAFLDITDRSTKAFHAAEFAVAEARNASERIGRVEVILTESVNDRRNLYAKILVLSEQIGALYKEVVTGNSGKCLRDKILAHETTIARLDERLAAMAEKKKRSRLFWVGIITAALATAATVGAALVELLVH